jgi:hypothetical protein
VAVSLWTKKASKLKRPAVWKKTFCLGRRANTFSSKRLCWLNPWRDQLNGYVRHDVSRWQLGIGTNRTVRASRPGGQPQGDQGHFPAIWKLWRAGNEFKSKPHFLIADELPLIAATRMLWKSARERSNQGGFQTPKNNLKSTIQLLWEPLLKM